MNYSVYSSRRVTLLTAATLLLLVGSGAIAYVAARPSSTEQPRISLGASGVSGSDNFGYGYRRLSKPDRTEILDSSGAPIGIMTDRARTAHIYGPARTFEEPRFTNAKIRTNI